LLLFFFECCSFSYLGYE